MLELVAGMNGAAMGHTGISVEYTDDRSPLGLKVGTGRDDVEIRDLMIIEATDANLAVRIDGDDTHIRTS
jgi:hypothetical protein